MHWNVVQNILKYLRWSKEVFVVYGGQLDPIVQGCIDGSFQTDYDDFKLQSGFVYIFNGGAVTWKSFKKETTADSTTEAEYIPASGAGKEGVWIKKFISDFDVVTSIANPLDLYCDNTGAIAQAKKPRNYQRSKHVLRRYYLIQEIVLKGDIGLSWVDTDSNTTDPCTKPLQYAKHEKHVSPWGLTTRRLVNLERDL